MERGRADEAGVDRTSLIIDCDPGVDDAIALLLAFASSELDLLAVTTAAGNVSADQTARNARIIRQIAGREDVPVHAGAVRPLKREPVEAGHFHGVSGLGDLAVFEPDAPGEMEPAAQAIIRLVKERPSGTVSIAAMGPLTNLAQAFSLDAGLAGRLQQVVLMGGARAEGGNITASAEFNIFADPDAAEAVFASGVPVVAFGLDATHQVRATAERVEAIRSLKGKPAETAAALFDFANRTEVREVGGTAAPLHDPCTIAWLLRPDLFELADCRIQVETGSDLTLGHTAVEFRLGLGDQTRPVARWAVRANADGVFDLLTERLAQ